MGPNATRSVTGTQRVALGEAAASRGQLLSHQCVAARRDEAQEWIPCNANSELVSAQPGPTRGVSR
jgi:hypothetical protein